MEKMNLQISDEVRELMESRHVVEEDMKKVIQNAEATGEKLYQEESDRFLARRRLGEATCYVEYSTGQDAYIAHTVYSHRAKIEGE